MRDFTFYNPTRIEFGKGKEKNIGQYINEYGYKNVLIIYGSQRVKKNGLFSSVANSLKEKGVDFDEVGGVVSNPLLSKTYECVAVAKNKNVDAILAVGGGSVLDTAKAVAAGAKYNGDVWDFFCGKAAVQAALPVFSILTLAATGSEMDSFGVVMNDETKEKFPIMSPLINPKVSVINPELMATVTKDYLAYSAVDIIAHSLDLYFTAKYLPNYNKELIESIVITVIRTTEVLLENPDDYDARGEFAWSATMALNGMTFVGVEGNSYDTHVIEHSLSALFNVAHGAGLAVVMPAWMKWHKDKNSSQYERFAKKIFNVEGADAGIQALENWFKKIGSPVTLAELNIPNESISDIADNVYGSAVLFGVVDQYPKQTIEEVLSFA